MNIIKQDEFNRVYETDLPSLVTMLSVELDDDHRAVSKMVKGSYGSGKNARKSEDWDDGVNLPQYLDMLRDGWPEGARRMQQLAAANPPAAQNAAAMRYVHDYAGQRPDVPRYIGGDMRSMIRRGSEFTPNPVRSIAFQLSASWTVKAKDMIGRSLAYCEMVDALDAQGIDCDVYGLWCWEKDGRKTSVLVKLKSAGQHVQREVFAATLGHPCFLRRLGFRWQECEPDRWPSWGDHPTDKNYLAQLDLDDSPYLPDGVDVYSISCGRLDDCRAELANQEPVRCPT
jgi:hypothetical protein